MIGEAFDGLYWGGNRKAARAARDRQTNLYMDGWQTYGLFKESLNGNKTYFVFAFDDSEDHEIMPRNPGSHPLGRRLNINTAHVGMRVAVETTEEYAHTLHNERGTIVAIHDPSYQYRNVLVNFDRFANKLAIEVHLLRQVPK